MFEGGAIELVGRWGESHGVAITFACICIYGHSYLDGQVPVRHHHQAPQPHDATAS